MTERTHIPESGETLSDDKMGSEAWKQHTKAIERVISVVLTVSRPETAKRIAEEAQVAEQTARDHLALLQELSIVASTTARGVTKYQPDAGYLRFKSIASVVEERSREEILDASQRIKERQEAVKDQYDVETPDDLRSRAVRDEISAEETAELRQAASEWETLQHDLSVFEQAYEHYGEHKDVGTSVSA